MNGSIEAVIVAKQNQYIRRFQEAGAVSPETAVDLMHIGCRESRIFRSLVAKGILKSISQGSYYIDLDVAREFRKKRRERALIALLIILAIAAAVIIVFTRR